MAAALTSAPPRNPYRPLVLAAAPLALLVVGLGAYVRLSDAGLACPDWPGCYGQLLGVPGHAEDVGRAWIEMTHRYAAGSLGLLALALAVAAWRRPVPARPWTESALAALVVGQALLGMWTVSGRLAPVAVSAHLVGGMLIWSLLVLLAWREFGADPADDVEVPPPVRLLGLAAALATLVQVALGGWVASHYAGLACPGFPACGAPLEGAAAIHWAHRLGAVAVAAAVSAYAMALVRFRPIAGIVLAGLLALQVGLGIGGQLLRLPLGLALAHNVGAALLLAALAVACFGRRP